MMLVALLLLVLSDFCKKKVREGCTGEPLQRGLVYRMVNFVAAGTLTAVVAIAILVSNVLAGVQASKLPEASDMMNHDRIDEGGGAATRMSAGSGHHRHEQHGAHHQT